MVLKRNFNFIISFIIYILFAITFIVVDKSISQYNLIELISQDYYSDNSIMFKINTDNKHTIGNNFDLLEKNQYAYKYTAKGISSIYFNESSKKWPIESGRFFANEDLNNSNKYAVVGKNVDSIKNKNKNFISIGNDNFEILGKLGIDIKSELDSKIILKGDKTDKIDGIWILDGDENIRQVYYQIKANMEKKDYKVDIINKEAVGISRIYGDVNPSKVIYLGASIICLLSLISLSYYNVLNKKNEISILILNGFSNLGIFNYTFFKDILINSISYISTVILSYFFIKLNYKFDISLFFTSRLFIILTLVNILIIFVFINRTRFIRGKI